MTLIKYVIHNYYHIVLSIDHINMLSKLHLHHVGILSAYTIRRGGVDVYVFRTARLV